MKDKKKKMKIKMEHLTKWMKRQFLEKHYRCMKEEYVSKIVYFVHKGESLKYYFLICFQIIHGKLIFVKKIFQNKDVEKMK